MNAGKRGWGLRVPAVARVQLKGRSWSTLWSPYECCACGGTRASAAVCPVCEEPATEREWVTLRDADGGEVRVPPLVAGAEGRYEDWVYLRMLEREWLRLVESDL